jgi:hypothetical protein
MVAAGSARAADATPRKYAILSLVGDRITMVTHRWTVGSNMDSNIQQPADMPNGMLDDTAAESAGKQIIKSEPGSKGVVLAWREPAAFKLQEGLLTPDANPQSPQAMLQGFLKQSKATHLLLITKQRGEVHISNLKDSALTGKLSGVGFFLDPSGSWTDRETQVSGRGLFAPYAYLMVSLVDAETGKVLRQQSVRHATSWSGIGKENLPAWNVVNNTQKFEVLQQIIGEAVAKGVTGALAAQ